MRYSLVVPVPTILVSAWNHRDVRFARSVFSDLARCATILLSLEVVWMILKLMELSGYPPGKLKYFERVHFCTLLAAFVVLSVNFLMKLMAGLYRERRDA
jgi:hypothetical protein